MGARGRTRRRLAFNVGTLLGTSLLTLALAPVAGANDGLHIAFGDVPVGTTDVETVLITLSDDGDELLLAELDDSSSPAFTLDNQCEGVAGPEASCWVLVFFTPDAAGPFAATLLLEQRHSEDGVVVIESEIQISGNGVQTATTTTLASSPNPSAIGESVTFTAEVAPASGAATPEGSVTFVHDVTDLATVALSGGTATFTTSSLGLGAHTITATYSGSAAHGQSSGTLTQDVLDAPALLDALHGDVTDVGPGSSLADKISKAQAYVAAGDIKKACRVLNEFIGEVRAQTGKSLTTTQGDELIAAAEQIRTLIGC